MGSDLRATPGLRTHELKTWPIYFEAIVDGSKTFEIRRNDRGFEVGDTLHLREFNPENGGSYTGRETTRRISYRTEMGQQTGFVVLGIVTPQDKAVKERCRVFAQRWCSQHGFPGGMLAVDPNGLEALVRECQSASLDPVRQQVLKKLETALASHGWSAVRRELREAIDLLKQEGSPR